MARNRAWVAAPAEAVWEVLADPFAYADWVVGAQRVFAADPEWPRPGSRLHHRVGLGPITTRDRTCVEECDEGRRIVLDAAARPFGRARVEITLAAEGSGTRIHIFEEPSGFTSLLRLSPVVQLGLRARNAEALRRLGQTAERRHRAGLRAARRRSSGPRAAATEQAG